MIQFISPYQTILLPDGQILPGCFPTIEWFNTIQSYISVQNKTIIDIGCCIFSYGIQALTNGAKFVTGLDISPIRVTESKQLIEFCGFNNEAEVICSSFEQYTPQKVYDLGLLSMIIHHLKDPEQQIKKLIVLFKRNLY